MQRFLFSCLLYIILITVFFSIGCAVNTGGSKEKETLNQEITRLNQEVARLNEELLRLTNENQKLKEEAAFIPASAKSAQNTSNAEQKNTKTINAVTPDAASSGVVSPGTVSPSMFIDVKGLEAERAILYLAALDILDSNSGKFKPHEPVTRREFARWLVKANNKYFKDNPQQQIHLAETGDAKFADIKQDDPDFKYIQGMANAGFVIGYDETHFKPDKVLSREEMIAIKQGLDQSGIPFKNQGLSMVETAWHFSDTNEISKKYADAVYNEYMNKAKNISRVYGTLKALSPKKSVTRGEAAICLERIGDNVWSTAGKALGKE